MWKLAKDYRQNGNALFHTTDKFVQWKQLREYGEHRSLTVRLLFMWIQKYGPHDLKPAGGFFNVIQTSCIYLRNILQGTCQMFTLWMKWPDCTSRDENHRAPYQSPLTSCTHGHTQLLEPLELQTESRSYLQTARTNIHLIFVLTTSSNNMQMSAFYMSRLLQCNKAKNYST